jgi:Uma2 family endonuclease
LAYLSLRYYLLVDANKKRCAYYVRDSHNESQTALLEENEELLISCDNYQTVLRLSDIYEDVRF